MPRGTLDDRARVGAYERLAPAVFRIAGCPPSWHQAVLAAVLSAGPESVASNGTAAYLHGLIERPPSRIEVTDHRCRMVRSRSSTVRRSRDLFGEHLDVVDAIPVTSAARTVVDLAGTWPRVAAEALDRGRRLDRFELQDVADVVIAVARQGRTGVVLMRELLLVRTAHLGRTESELEDLFLQRLLTMQVPLPQAQVEVRDDTGAFICRADFGYPGSKTLIELDSQKWHGDAAATKADRTKQNRLVALGYQVYRYTWWHCAYDWRQMGNELLAAVGRVPGAVAPVGPV